MQLTLKKDINIKKQDTISIDEINFTTLTILKKDEERGLLSINYNLVNLNIKIKDNKNEEIGKIIDKIDKYQKSKMSSKEISKMISKISKYPSLEELIINMNNNEPLSDYMISLLNTELVNSEYYVDLRSKILKIFL